MFSFYIHTRIHFFLDRRIGASQFFSIPPSMVLKNCKSFLQKKKNQKYIWCWVKTRWHLVLTPCPLLWKIQFFHPFLSCVTHLFFIWMFVSNIHISLSMEVESIHVSKTHLFFSHISPSCWLHYFSSISFHNSNISNSSAPVTHNCHWFPSSGILPSYFPLWLWSCWYYTGEWGNNSISHLLEWVSPATRQITSWGSAGLQLKFSYR